MDQIVISVNGTDDDPDYDWKTQTQSPRDFYTQLIISVALGLSAFIAFCILRPRWTALYAARKRRMSAASTLPELPSSTFGWIPVLYGITEQQVLMSAGLDAFVFLRFFKMAIKFVSTTFLFSVIVLLPVHSYLTGDWGWGIPSNSTTKPDYDDLPLINALDWNVSVTATFKDGTKPPTGYLWMYVIFTYIFTGLAILLVIMETKRVIEVRQRYLGSQTTITDRTLRLSGIPPELRSEKKIKDFIENLQIGKVDSVLLCREWRQLDRLIDERTKILRKLEEAWTAYLGFRRTNLNQVSLPIIQSSSVPPVYHRPDNEESLLLSGENSSPEVRRPRAKRPTTLIWHGFLNLRWKKIDAINYYEEKLRRIDLKIGIARSRKYTPTPLAFVTMDSVAACQMAMQAILDPSPMQLITKPAPAPVDVIWKNTYLPRSSRMIRSWTITLFIIVLTLFWSISLVPVAGLLNLKSIHKYFPSLADALSQHPLSKSLVTTGLPTLAISLLGVAVPYFYYWLSTLQGMTSQGDVELSVISKNFFFTFFNLFLVFTIFGTASNFYGFVENLREALKDTTRVAYTLAGSLQYLSPFYTNFIVLQGLGLLPLRLLEFGSIALYPINLISARTPRDYAELVRPPEFSYGFFLPQSILIFMICIVYSVLRYSWRVSGFGLIYFVIGHFIHKYQLLYAMDHRQHSTGRAWPMICNRVIMGLLVFQLAMFGVLALQTAFKRAALIIPLAAVTLWFSYSFRYSFEPLMKFIALRSIERDESGNVAISESSRSGRETHGSTIDESEERGMKYIHPNLVSSLDDAWITNLRNGRNQEV